MVSVGLVVKVMVGVGLLAGVGLLFRLLRAPAETPYTAASRCACGWRGQVSRYSPRCPRCGNSEVRPG